MIRVFRKGLTGPSDLLTGKHLKDVTVHRGGTTFTQKRMVRDDAAVGPSRPAEELEAEKKETKERETTVTKEFEDLMAKADPATKKKLNTLAGKLAKAIKDLVPGDRKKIGNLTLTGAAKGRVLVCGVAAHSLRAATLIAYAMDSMAETGAQHVSGALHAHAQDTGALVRIGQKAEAKVQATKQKAAR